MVLQLDGEQLDLDFIRVAYDIEKVVSMIKATDMPDEFAQMLRDGSG